MRYDIKFIQEKILAKAELFVLEELFHGKQLKEVGDIQKHLFWRPYRIIKALRICWAKIQK